MTALQALVYGIIQGLTEFLPISSTAHLRVIPALLGWDDPGAAFTAVIQWGTLVAVLLYFRRDIAALTVAFVQGLTSGKPWATIAARAAVPLREPIASGFRIRRTVPLASMR